MDASCRDLCRNQRPFGGKVVLFGGDHRQTLPVVRHGERARIVAITLKRWNLWPTLRQFHLRENVRIRQHANATGDDGNRHQEFADFLLRIGEGREPSTTHNRHNDYNTLPDEICVDSQDELIDNVFPGLADGRVYKARSILTTKNDIALALNNKILARFPGEEQVFYSADSVSNDDVGANFPVEFLNTLTPSCMPPHILRLKINAPIILLRNLSQLQGLCNGTRLICRGLQPHVLDCEIISGSDWAIGRRVFIPRMTLTPSDSGLPFEMQRRQFPVSLCYSMTINKSQSQTMEFVGIYLPENVFAHGQLYVAMSRVGGFDCIKVCLNGARQTRNIVYNEIL